LLLYADTRIARLDRRTSLTMNFRQLPQVQLDPGNFSSRNLHLPLLRQVTIQFDEHGLGTSRDREKTIGFADIPSLK
jgi:hypothetical protein